MIPASSKMRLDKILFEKKLVKDRRAAFVVVTEGRVLVNGQKAISPAQLIQRDAVIDVRGDTKYVGRGAYKLEAALDEFKIDPAGKACADLGAATGGFTEVLLNRGAARVYAIDTARGKLALKLREDPRVAVMEGMDARDIDGLSELIDIAAIDVSLVSLRDMLPAARRLLRSDGMVIALFKPQYETRDPKILRHGVIRDGADREALVKEFRDWAVAHGWNIKGQIESPIRGSGGNIEYLLALRPPMY